ncbi:MAG: hypothetical protein GX100_04670 [candidate division WS1 bacterium]|nr:hypothetical protein [candidate division WS1 bacterium]
MHTFNSETRGAAPSSLAHTRELAVGGMCLALAVVVPILFHAVGGGLAGRTFLPMFLPILLLGLLTRPQVAVLGGVLAPFVSSLLTGMPPFLPTALLMAAELGAMAGVASVLRQALRGNVWLAAVIAVATGRAVMALEAALLGNVLLQLELSWPVYVGATLVAGLPGTLLLVVLVPPLALALERASRLGPMRGEAA